MSTTDKSDMCGSPTDLVRDYLGSGVEGDLLLHGSKPATVKFYCLSQINSSVDVQARRIPYSMALEIRIRKIGLFKIRISSIYYQNGNRPLMSSRPPPGSPFLRRQPRVVM